MSRRILLAAISITLLASPTVAAAQAPAMAGGKLGILPTGRYLCELPGDATGPVSRPLKDEWFDVVNASSYRSSGGAGTYLLTGETVVFTRGPMRGARFERTTPRALRRIDVSGDLANMRCIRTGRAE